MSQKNKSPKVEAEPIIEEPRGDLMNRFYTGKICEIFRTSAHEKPDVFEEYRPKSKRDCLDYNISQTNTKMDAGPTKIHYQETQVEYAQHPPDHFFEEDRPLPRKPKKKRKFPAKEREGAVWVFEDEKRAAKIETQQRKARRELRKRLLRKARKKRFENEYLYLLLYSPEERQKKRLRSAKDPEAN